MSSTRAETVTNNLYRERAHLVAHLAALYPSVMVPEADPAAEGWPVVYITLPTGQASWHIAPADLDLFAHVPEGTAVWDGHETHDKYYRLDLATAAALGVYAKARTLLDLAEIAPAFPVLFSPADLERMAAARNTLPPTFCGNSSEATFHPAPEDGTDG